MHRAPTAAAFLISPTMLLALVACTGTTGPAEQPTATDAPAKEPSTLEPARHTPIQTLDPHQVEGTRRAQLATVNANIPTPTSVVVRTYPTPVAPVVVQVATPAKCPSVASKT